MTGETRETHFFKPAEDISWCWFGIRQDNNLFKENHEKNVMAHAGHIWE
jgi:hypothetical protein